MRVLSAAAIAAVGATTAVSAHSFSSCASTDHLHITEMDFAPSEVAVPGESFAVTLKGTTDEAVNAGTVADVAIKLYGVTLYSERMDVCSLVACPVQEGPLDLTVEYPVPEQAPAGISVDLHVKVSAASGDEMGCVSTKVTTGRKPSVAAAKKMLGKTHGVFWKPEQAKWLFDLYLKHHDLAASVAHEYEERLAVFMKALREIYLHNAVKDRTFTKGLTPFAHLTPEEFKQTRLGYRADLAKPAGRPVVIPDAPWYEQLLTVGDPLAYAMDKIRQAGVINVEGRFAAASAPAFADFEVKPLKDLPASVDWVSKGAVTPVKDQGACGSCWAFSTTGALEGAYFLKTGKLVSFSEEQLVACDKTCYACSGGLMDLAFEWIEENGGLCSEDSWPYSSKSGQVPVCGSQACTPVAGSRPAGFTDVPQNDEQALMTAVAQQPVAVAIEADQAAFQLYHSGVVTGSCGDALDHGVLVVGYGTDEVTGVDYWKIKNSWGGLWGEQGYVRIQRGKSFPFGRRDGECGVLKSASFVSGFSD